MSPTYRMAKAYQEQLLRESGPPKEEEALPPRAPSVPRPGISAFADRLWTALLLYRQATDTETTARSSLT